MAAKEEPKKVTCGIIMPISNTEGYPQGHWQSVKELIEHAINGADFLSQLVSVSDEVRVIHGTNVQNLFDNEIVVCDVSSKNPNVMFELGMRLAFDMPTVIVKDDDTNYIFDTMPIEHLEYPKAMTYKECLKFKEDLTAKLKSTHEAAKKPDATSFLKHFKRMKVAEMETENVSFQKYTEQTLKSIISEMLSIKEIVLSSNQTKEEQLFSHIKSPFIDKYFELNKTMFKRDQLIKEAALLRRGIVEFSNSNNIELENGGTN